VTATITAAGSFDNSATASATQPDPNSGNNTDNTGNGGTAAASADVSMVKTLTTAGPFTAGQSISYTLVVANAGPSTATNVLVTDTPTNLTITAVSGGGCAALPCTIATLASGSNVTISVTATITAAGAFNNSATAAATQPDPNSGNNTDNTGNGGVTGAQSVDVGIVKTAGSLPPVVAEPFDYTLAVTNHGPITATGVVVTDPLPANFALVSATSTQGSCSGTTTVTCNIGTMLNGASVTITIRGTPGTAGPMTNNATVAANEPESLTANNSSTIAVDVVEDVPALGSYGLMLLAFALAVTAAFVMRTRG
ncbi:MAG: large repetitive protein, partial [Thermoanaerobaculia bacterium]|nr:large repetitive protein [Thermoanaerobaculia bacterium]